MKHRKPIIAAFAITLASTAALAQSGPDFGPPLRPGDLEEQRAQPQPTPYERRATTENRMLEAYEASAPQPDEPYPPQAYETPRERVSTQPPPQSTIGDGLFERRGPNDFGS